MDENYYLITQAMKTKSIHDLATQVRRIEDKIGERNEGATLSYENNHLRLLVWGIYVRYNANIVAYVGFPMFGTEQVSQPIYMGKEAEQ